jgi:ferritin-like protein
MQNTDKPAGMKLFPRNLTARAAYLVRGNPVVSRPESGADNAHPGLEFDQRNLDRGFFPGLLFDFQFGAGARLAAVQAPWAEKKESDGRACLDAKEGEFFLWYVYGFFGDQPAIPQLADLYGLDGYEVLRKVHDLEPGRLIVVVGRRPDQLSVDNVPAWLGAMRELVVQVSGSQGCDPGEQIRTFRDDTGNLQFAILTSRRAAYLDEQGVIDLKTAEVGALTRSLCSPWQWDFTDCGCYYWAASRPDIVTGADGRERLNFIRIDREGKIRIDSEGKPLAAEAITDWSTWTAGNMSAPQMILNWETLPVVINDRESERYEPAKLPQLGELWDRATVTSWLKYLATVEHALAVKFLYAHYSVKAPAGGTAHAPIMATDLPVTKVAKEIFHIAIDEMRHFRWVNEILQTLGAAPVFDRATELERLTGPSTPPLEPIPLRLEALTPKSLERFIEIERPSQAYKPDEIAGLYTHILVSLDRRPEEYSRDERERVQEVCKLIVDEGDGHWRRAEDIQKLLAGKELGEYLWFTGEPVREPRDSEWGALQVLGDQYYALMLDILRQAFAPNVKMRGPTIRQAQRVMHNLHDVGQVLGAQGRGLLFTMPPAPQPGDLAKGNAALALATSIPRLLAPLAQLKSQDLANLAARHAQFASELKDDLEEDEP